MIARTTSAAINGIDAFRVELEVDVTRQGIPSFTMVGLAEGAVRESKERVMSALKNAGYKLPPARITVNLAPADIRKAGSGYDLPLALALLAAAEVLPEQSRDMLAATYISGELSLDGRVKPVPGVLPMAMLAREDSCRSMLVPVDNAAEAAVIRDLHVHPVDSLSRAVAHFSGDPIQEVRESEVVMPDLSGLSGQMDFDEVKGQEFAKRAIEIAAAGRHNLLFVGPPGSGKTMLAKRIPTVLPPLTFDEALDVTRIYSVANLLGAGKSLLAERPFRAPHHTISDAGLVGGGHIPKPGEVSLAHRGVLFLDELPEFKKAVLEVLRQPLEDGVVTISRAAMSVTFPANLMLVAAMNPCPCGHLGDSAHACHCSPMQIQRYASRISGPLLDRIDMHVEVPNVPYKDLKATRKGAGSREMRERVCNARDRQQVRYQGTDIISNAELSGKSLDEHCRLTSEHHGFLEKVVTNLGLSARAFTRILRVARTIADLDGDGDIGSSHLAEAVNYRGLDIRSSTGA